MNPRVAAAVATVGKVFSIKKYPTADLNAGVFSLVRQGLAYYLRSDGTAPPPLSVFVNINRACPLKCKMCDYGTGNEESIFYRNLMGTQEGDMPIERFKKLVDEIAHFRPFVSLPALEPIVYKPLIEAIEYVVRHAGLRMCINTSGVALEKRAPEIVEAGLHKMVISIDGPEAVHDQQRGVNGTFQRALRGLRALSEAKKRHGTRYPLVYVNTVVTDGNFHSIVNLMESLPVDDIERVDLRLLFYCTPELARKHNETWGSEYPATDAGLSGGIDLDRIEIGEFRDQIRQAQERWGEKIVPFFDTREAHLQRYFGEPETFLDSRPCVFPWFTAQIAQNGEMIGPQRCYTKNYGNVFERGFDACWNGPEMVKFRKDLQKHGRFTACPRCEGVLY